MKTFRLIGMALLAVCVTFASCSSDDEETTKNEDGIVTNQKRLVELRMTEENEVSITQYSYDSQGRLVSATNTVQYGSREYTSTYTVTWGANKIIESRDVLPITGANHLRSIPLSEDSLCKIFRYKTIRKCLHRHSSMPF